MEHYRPDGMISRDDAVYMVDDPDDIINAGGIIDFIYEVVPIGPVERSDLGWYREVKGAMNLEKSDEATREFAESYWDGVSYHGIGVWEYRARQARVIGDA